MVDASRDNFGRVRVGSALIGIGVVQFCAAMAVVQAGYPGYSDVTNYISDLGNTATSPWHWGFNVSIILLGVLAFAGILLAWDGFPSGRSRTVGIVLLLVASVGAIGVGVFPENVNGTVHGLSSLAVFLPGGLALVILGVGFRRKGSWSWFTVPSILLGLVDLVALAYYVPTQGTNSTWDPGLVERFIVFPILVWGLLAAAQLVRRAGATSPAGATPT
ncbi:MAG TPA: DUF998 domain-containing protein [Thermoplasmata archaeon]|nr:DUF998 domain-containing protein [Thermoplasmata archaeon]